MSSITKTKTGVQPLDTDDGILADSMSDGESSGVSEGDGPLRQADEAESITTISGDGPEILRVTIIENKVLEELVRHSNLNQRTTTHPSTPPA